MTTPKVSGLAGFGLTVPDLAAAQKFYGDFGLEARTLGPVLGLRSQGRQHDEIVLLPGSGKRLHHVSFFAGDEDLSRFAEHFRSMGLDPVETPPDGAARAGLWAQDPWGTWIHLAPGRAAPLSQHALHPANTGGQVSRVDVNLWQELPKERGPQRIGHMLVFSDAWEKAEAFYSELLGLRTTDRAKGKVAFMAAGEGVTDHHCFGFVNSTHRGFQHASFEVASFDDIGYGAWRMRKAGHGNGFGPGRHAIASNLFHYVRDPWGSWVEYYADMDKITGAWQCRDWQDLPYTWGPEWSPEFWGGDMNANHEPR